MKSIVQYYLKVIKTICFNLSCFICELTKDFIWKFGKLVLKKPCTILEYTMYESFVEA